MEAFVLQSLVRETLRDEILSGVPSLAVATSDDATFESYLAALISSHPEYRLLQWTIPSGLTYYTRNNSYSVKLIDTRREDSQPASIGHIGSMGMLLDPQSTMDHIVLQFSPVADRTADTFQSDCLLPSSVAALQTAPETSAQNFNRQAGTQLPEPQRVESLLLYLPDFHRLWDNFNDLSYLKYTISQIEMRHLSHKVIVSFPLGVSIPPELRSLMFLDLFSSPTQNEFTRLIGAWLQTQCELLNQDSLREFERRTGVAIDTLEESQIARPESFLSDDCCPESGEWNDESRTLAVEQLAEASAGLTWQEAKGAFTISYQQTGGLSVREVQHTKITFLNQHPALTIHHPHMLPTYSDIGGYDPIKNYLSRHMAVFNAENRHTVKDMGMPWPKGCLFLGIPGCGKSMIARATARESGMLACEFDIGAVMDKYVGGSEANIRSAIEIMEKAAGDHGLVVVMDEIEKQLAGNSNAGASDAGTSARVHRTLLSWLQDRVSPVIIFMTANNIDQVPPEFLRPGRVDSIFWFDLPSSEERTSILQVHLNHYHLIPQQVNVEEIATNDLKRYTGAEIENLVHECALAVIHGEHESINDDLVKEVAESVRLQADTHEEQLTKLRHRAREFRLANIPDLDDLRTPVGRRNSPTSSSSLRRVEEEDFDSEPQF